MATDKQPDLAWSDIVSEDWTGTCALCQKPMTWQDWAAGNVVAIAQTEPKPFTVAAHAHHATESDESYQNLIAAMANEAKTKLEAADKDG